jgi:hypothetical protein
VLELRESHERLQSMKLATHVHDHVGITLLCYCLGKSQLRVFQATTDEAKVLVITEFEGILKCYLVLVFRRVDDVVFKYHIELRPEERR